MEKPLIRRTIFSLTRFIVAFVAILTLLFLVNDASFRIFRKIRPLLDISRDVWIQGYLKVCGITVFIVCILSIIFYLAETFIHKNASINRCIAHIITLFLVAVIACVIVFILLPFNNEMAPLVYGIICGIVLLQIITHLFLVPPANYESLH
jgi:membrane-associated HD superfamily phosphohydrolase